MTKPTSLAFTALALINTACAPSYQQMPYQTQVQQVRSNRPPSIQRHLEWFSPHGLPCASDLKFSAERPIDTLVNPRAVGQGLGMDSTTTQMFGQMVNTMKLVDMTTECGSPVALRGGTSHRSYGSPTIGTDEIMISDTGEYNVGGLTCSGSATLVAGWKVPGGLQGPAVISEFNNLMVPVGMSLVTYAIKDRNGDLHTSHIRCDLSTYKVTPYYTPQ